MKSSKGHVQWKHILIPEIEATLDQSSDRTVERLYSWLQKKFWAKFAPHPGGKGQSWIPANWIGVCNKGRATSIGETGKTNERHETVISKITWLKTIHWSSECSEIRRKTHFSIIHLSFQNCLWSNITTQYFITISNTSKFLKNTPLCFLFSTLFLGFDLEMKRKLSHTANITCGEFYRAIPQIWEKSDWHTLLAQSCISSIA